MDERTITSENLDDLEVRLIVLAKNSRGVAQAATFMSKRGWPTLVFEDVGKAISEISKNPPDFVLLSLNHPSPKILKLPTLLSQAFSIPCVMFIESNDASSVLNLQNSPERYKLTGSSSGPSIQRYIRKLLIELYGIAAPEKESTTEHQSDDKSGSVRVMGQENGDGKNILVEGTAPTSGGRRSLAALKKAAPAVNVSNPSALQQQLMALASGGDGVAYNPTQSSSERPKGPAYQGSATAASGPAIPSNSSSVMSANSLSTNPPSGGMGQAGLLSSGSPVATGGPSGGEVGFDPTSRSPGAQQNSGGPQNPAPSPTTAETERLGTLQDFMRQMINDLADLLKNSVEPIEATSKEVCVISVDSPELHGYAVFAVPLSGPQKIQFAKQIAAVMPKTLSAGTVSLSPPIIIPFLQKSFKGIEQHASFIETLNVGTPAETGVAFFKTEQRLPIPRRNTDKMSRIPIREISPDIPVNFETYLQMTRNNKYLLYLRTGRKLMQRQRMSLLENDVLEFHISEKEEAKFRAYMAYGFFFQLSKSQTASEPKAS
jgi:hypothetical protein